MTLSLSFGELAKRPVAIATIAAVLLAMFSFVAPKAHAAEFVASGVLFESMDDATAVSTTVGERIIVFADVATAGVEASVKVSFPSATVNGGNFSGNATAANWTTSTADLPNTIAGKTVSPWTGIGATGASVSGTNNTAITFASGNLDDAQTGVFAFAITAGLTKPGVSTDSEFTNGLITTQTNTPATVDESEWATEMLDGAGKDEISVTATVDANFEYTLDTTTLALGTLSDASISSTPGNNITIATNGDAGYGIFARLLGDADGSAANQGLFSGAESYNIDATGTSDGTPETITAGTEQVALDVDLTTAVNNTANGTSGTVPTAAQAEYNGTTSQGGSLNQTALQELAKRDGRTTGDVWTLILRATISDATPEATDYEALLEVVAVGAF